MDTLKHIGFAVSLVANLLTMVASAIAIYLFFAKREELSNAFRLLMGWSFQTTLTELKEKLERLNEYNANEPSEMDEIRNILQEIAGQMRGNERLLASAPNLAKRIEALATDKRLTEPRKRSIVSEIREVVRNIQVNSLSTNPGGDNV